MIFIVALYSSPIRRARMISRECAPDRLVRIGGDPDDDLVLDGFSGLSLELVCDGQRWLIAAGESALREIRDGDRIRRDSWEIHLITPVEHSGAEPDPSASALEGTLDAIATGEILPRFEVECAPPAFVPIGAPSLLGSAPFCSVSIPTLNRPCIAIVYRDASSRKSRLYPIHGAALELAGRAIDRPRLLKNGDTIRILDEALEMHFRDPDDELDALLDLNGGKRNEEIPKSTTAVPKPSLLSALSPAQALRFDGLTPSDLAFGAVSFSCLVVFLLIVCLRW